MLPPHIKDAIHHYIPVQEGWFDPERCCDMAELIISEQPEIVVEIGTFGGRSLIAQAMALRENGHGQIFGIDPWKKEAALEGDNGPENNDYWNKLDLHDIHRGCMECVWAHKLDKFAVVIRAKSEDCIKLFHGRYIDILLIDGNHSEECSCRDVELYVPQVKYGGYVWFDDCDWTTTQKALKLMEDYCKCVRDSGTTRLYQRFTLQETLERADKKNALPVQT